MVQFYPGGRPKAVTGPARAAACHRPCQIAGLSPCPIGPSADERAVPGIMRGAVRSSRSADVRMDRYALTAEPSTGLPEFRVPCNHVTRWSLATCWHDA